MKCLFGHQWSGCKCERCGKTRNKNHSWQGLKCNVCGAECFDGNDLKAMAEICGIAAGFGVFRAEANAQILEIGEKILSRSDFAKDDMFLIMVCMQMFGASYDAILKNNPQCKSALAQIPLFTSKITEYNRRKGYIDGNWPDITKFFKNGISPDDISKGNFISATKKNTNLTNVQASLETKPDLDKQESQQNSVYTSNDTVRGILYVRFNIDAVEGGAYGLACYKIVFANAPTHALQGCVVSMGDSDATLSGRENVCVIGLEGSVGQLRIIMNALKSTMAFTSVCASNPLVLNGGAEPLVEDGTYTEDGSLLSSWAKSAFNSVNTR